MGTSPGRRRLLGWIWGGLLGAVLMVVILQMFKGLLSLPRPLGVLPEDLVTTSPIATSSPTDAPDNADRAVDGDGDESDDDTEGLPLFGGDTSPSTHSETETT